MRTTLMSAALAMVLGLFVVGCASDSAMKDDKMMKDDKTMSTIGDRSADKITVATARGPVTYGWDSTKKVPMVLSGEAPACEAIPGIISAYYVHGRMPPETCPCGSKMSLIKAG